MLLGWDRHGDQDGPVTTAHIQRYALERSKDPCMNQ